MIFKLTVAVVVPTLLAAASPDPKKAGMDPGRLALIPVRMQEFVDRGAVAGVVTLVARHGALAEIDAVGWQDIEAKKPMRTDTIFQIMSMTKPVTSTGIVMLAEDGKLALTDPVEKYLPEFKGQWLIESREGNSRRTLKAPSRPIIIRDLLTHTSGLPEDPPENIRPVFANFRLTLPEAVALYSQTPLEFEPGTKFGYSNLGMATLGRIIEVVSDRPYEKFIEERILKPLGMKDTFYFPPEDKLSRIATVYRPPEGGKLERAFAEGPGGERREFRKGAKYPAPEGGLYSTASDLAAFYQMMLNRGTFDGQRVLSPASVDLMTELQTGSIPAPHGLAWVVVTDAFDTLNYQSIGSYGHGGAYGTFGWVDPKKDTVEVLLIQRSVWGNFDERNAFWALAASAIRE